MNGLSPGGSWRVEVFESVFVVVGVDEDWTMGVMKNVMTNTAQDGSLHCSTAPRSHHDEVRLVFFCFSQDLLPCERLYFFAGF